MKKILLLFAILANSTLIYAQHNYDNEGVIYSDGAKLGLNDSSPMVTFDISGEQNTMLRLHRKNNVSLAPWGIGFSTRSDGTDLSNLSDLRSGIFGMYNGDIFLSAKQGVDIDADPLAYSRLYVDGNTGNVGIGATSPVDPFHIQNNTTTYMRKGEFKFKPGYFGTPEGGSDLYNWLQSSYSTNTSWDLGLGGDDWNGAEPLMMIKRDGKVGIGTLTPSSHFAIETDDLSVFQAKSNRVDGANVSRFVNDADRGFIFTSYGSGYSAGSYFGIGTNNGALTFNQKAAIGTVVNEDLELGTNGTTRMTVTKSGDVGIGTKSPGTKLEVESASNTMLKIETTSAVNYAGIQLYGKRAAGNSSIHTIRTQGTSNYNLEIIADETLYLKTNGVSRLTALGTGNVGIGVDNPGSKLTVNGNISSTLGTGARLTLFDDDAVRNNRLIAGADGDGAYLQSTWSTGGTDAISFRNSANEQVMLVTNQDNVNIGTTTLYSDYKLSVAGNGQFEEVKVHPEIEWMDIVFEEDYDLRSLEDVQEYIDENGHLPDIPSADEVGKNGFNLGEMDANLLRKIEELTLYLLEKENEVESLNERVSQLEKLILDRQ